MITVEAAYAKNGEARSVPMNSVLTETLKAIRISDDPIESVFQSPTGGPYRNFRAAFENALKRVGIPDFTFHDLRHTFASRLVMKGVDLATVQQLLGHKDIKMTMRYAHPSPDHKQKAVELLSEGEPKVTTIFTTAQKEVKPLSRVKA